jgi:hypothetical protein
MPIRMSESAFSSRVTLAPYRTFTQDNMLDERTDAVLPRDILLKKGMTLDQLGSLLALQPLNVEVRHAGDATLDEFRARARGYLGQKDHFVITNYLRMTIGQERGGHISPLAAYEAKTDRFLILDVARYKYPPEMSALPTKADMRPSHPEMSAKCQKRT